MSKFRNGSLIAIGMVMMAVALVAAGSRGAGAQSASSVSEVRDVDNPARQPFQRELNFTVAAGKASSGALLLLPRRRSVSSLNTRLRSLTCPAVSAW